MTPLEFREKAFLQIESAKQLLATSPAQSWYMAGYALEFYLKAILCRKRGWARFPEDKQELNALNARAGRPKEKTFTHDIDELLKHSDLIFLKKSSYKNIDWGIALEWSEQIRYRSESDITLEKASTCLNEIEGAVQELQIYELLYYVQLIEKELTDIYGRFHCFVMSESDQETRWDIIASWLSPTIELHEKRHNHIYQLTRKNVPEDLFNKLKGVLVIPTESPLAQSTIKFVRILSGPIFQNPRFLSKGNRISGGPPPPNGFYITVANWNWGDLKNDWQRLGLIDGNSIEMKGTAKFVFDQSKSTGGRVLLLINRVQQM
jgi:hypothetical protein